MNQEEEQKEEDSDEYDVELSSDEDDQDVNLIVLNYQNQAVKDYMIPEEPQLYILSLNVIETNFEVDADDMED